MTALKIISIVLKPAQIVSLVAGMGLVAYFTMEQHDEVKPKSDSKRLDLYDVGFFGRQEFFLYSTGVGVVFAVLGLVCVIAGLLQKKHGAVAMSAVQAICALQLLVSTALVAKILTTHQEEREEYLGFKHPSPCEIWDKTKNREYEYTCGQLTGGVVCGFVASVAFAVDAAISFESHKRAE